MPSAAPAHRPGGSAGQHDNQPEYDQAVDDFMRDLEFNNDTTNTNGAPQDPAKDFDEEVQVKKKRRPNPKLDEARLLSNNGVPKLRRLARSRLKFRGKGNEYADITTLLNMYQLWLDDLYPKAKFKDGLTMVEKVGHSKRMQITRKAWLDATKPHAREDSPERFEDVQMSGGLGDAEDVGATAGGADDDGFGRASQQEQAGGADQDHGNEDAPEEDELDALMNENENAGTGAAPNVPSTHKAPGPFEEDSDPEEDELDALLAEENNNRPDAASASKGSNHAKPSAGDGGDDSADDEEAMADMNW